MSRPGFLFVTGSFWDEARQKTYSAALPPIYRQYQGRYLALGGGAAVTVEEGRWHPRGVVLARFATPGDVERFWWSPEYRAAAQVRQGGGAFTVLALPGSDDPPPGGVFLITFARLAADRFEPVAARFEALVRVHGGRTIATASPNALRPLEGAFFDTGLVIQHWPTDAGLRTYLADSAYGALAAERRAFGEVVVLSRAAMAA